MEQCTGHINEPHLPVDVRTPLPGNPGPPGEFSLPHFVSTQTTLPKQDKTGKKVKISRQQERTMSNSSLIKC